MNYKNDKRIVLTLDAGGTNLVFSAIQGQEEIIGPVHMPSNAHDLDLCLDNIVEGFSQILNRLDQNPSAISFAFPGPADYPAGIIGDLANLPCFRGGVALGPMLERKFKLPVFINNDGDLFAYGEAIAGILPDMNKRLKEAGGVKEYKNVLGLTFGTGFGGGIVTDGQLFLGDNSASAEIWSMRNKSYSDTFVEEGVSARGIQKAYARGAGLQQWDHITPKEIYEIANGDVQGNRQAAIDAFREFGDVAGDAIANASILIDGIVVVGGGLTGAYPLFMPSIVNEMNGCLKSYDGKDVLRMESKVYNLEEPDELSKFLHGKVKEIVIPGTDEKVLYDPDKRIGIGISRLGTSKAVGIGAYVFALNEIDRR